jgi:serine/threonine-protein kinase
VTDGLVAGRFRLTALLGSGGTAAVFAAVDELVDRPVALKLLHPHLAADRAAWDAFFEEVRAARSIVHPLIAEVFDAGAVDTDPPVVWIAMELVDGVSLDEHVRAHGALPGPAARVLVDGVLDALAAAHAGGVVHRDITPANVMLDPAALEPFDADRFRAGIRLLDFGLADVPGRTTRGSDALLTAPGDASAGVVASVPYASPEQLSGAPVTEASDVYQVGATLYFALTGRPPFEGATDVVVRAHLTAPPPLPSVVRRDVERTMDRLVATAMLKRPGDRFADAGRMRSALSPALPTAATAVIAPGADPVATSAGTMSAGTVAAGAVGVGADDASPDARTRVHEAAGADVADASTRVYRTALPSAPAATGLLPGGSPTRRSRRGVWAAVAAGAVALVGIIALSAAAGSAPSAAPTPGAVSAFPSRTAAPVSPPPSVAAPVLAEVPAIVGLSRDEAAALLVQQGFTVGSESRADGTAASDIVLSSEPAPGSRREPGTAVALQVASGRNAVPSVVGLSAAEASQALAAAGFAAAVDDRGTGAPGVVAGSTPAAGSVQPLGATITLHVPPVPPPSAPPAPQPSTTPTPQPSGTATPAAP